MGSPSSSPETKPSRVDTLVREAEAKPDAVQAKAHIDERMKTLALTAEETEELHEKIERSAVLRKNADLLASVKAQVEANGTKAPKKKDATDTNEESKEDTREVQPAETYGLKNQINEFSENVAVSILGEKRTEGWTAKEKRNAGLAITVGTAALAGLAIWLFTRGRNAAKEGEEAAEKSGGGWFKKTLIFLGVSGALFLGWKGMEAKWKYDAAKKEIGEKVKSAGEKVKDGIEAGKDAMDEMDDEDKEMLREAGQMEYMRGIGRGVMFFHGDLAAKAGMTEEVHKEAFLALLGTKEIQEMKMGEIIAFADRGGLQLPSSLHDRGDDMRTALTFLGLVCKKHCETNATNPALKNETVLTFLKQVSMPSSGFDRVAHAIAKNGMKTIDVSTLTEAMTGSGGAMQEVLDQGNVFEKIRAKVPGIEKKKTEFAAYCLAHRTDFAYQSKKGVNENIDPDFKKALAVMTEDVQEHKEYFGLYTHGHTRRDGTKTVDVLNKYIGTGESDSKLKINDVLQLYAYGELARPDKGDEPSPLDKAKPMGAFMLQMKILEMVSATDAEQGKSFRNFLLDEGVKTTAGMATTIKLPEETKMFMQRLGEIALNETVKYSTGTMRWLWKEWETRVVDTTGLPKEYVGPTHSVAATGGLVTMKLWKETIETNYAFINKINSTSGLLHGSDRLSRDLLRAQTDWGNVRKIPGMREVNPFSIVYHRFRSNSLLKKARRTLLETNATKKQLLDAGVGIREILKKYGDTAGTLDDIAKDLTHVGEMGRIKAINELRGAGKPVSDLLSRGISIHDALKGGFRVDDLVKAGCKSDDVIRVVGTLIDDANRTGALDVSKRLALQSEAGHYIKQLMQSGAKVDDLTKAGITLKDIRAARSATRLTAVTSFAKGTVLLDAAIIGLEGYLYFAHARPELLAKYNKTTDPMQREQIIRELRSQEGGLAINTTGTVLIYTPLAPVGVAMIVANEVGQPMRRSVEEGTTYMLQTEKQLMEYPAGNMLWHVGRSTRLSNVSWGQAAASIGMRETFRDANTMARAEGYGAYFRQSALWSLPPLTVADLSPSDQKLDVVEQKARMDIRSNDELGIFSISALMYLQQVTGNTFEKVDPNTLRKAGTYALKRTLQFRAMQTKGESIDFGKTPSTWDEKLNVTDNEQAQFEALRSVDIARLADDPAAFKEMAPLKLLQALEHDLAYGESRLLETDFSNWSGMFGGYWESEEGLRSVVRGLYAQKVFDAIVKLVHKSDAGDEIEPTDVQATISDVRNMLLTGNPDQMAFANLGKSETQELRTLGENPNRLSIYGIMDMIQKTPL